MRQFVMAAVLASTCIFAVGGEAKAQTEYAWCAFYDDYTRNCGFDTFQQCLDTVRGVGGDCRRNPRASSSGERGGQSRERESEPQFQFRPFGR
jgi:hypothetical protein